MTDGFSRTLALGALATMLALGACKKNDVNEKNVDAGTVAAKVAGAAAGDKPQPGRWEMALKLDSIEVPGMPPEAQAMMRKQTGTIRKIATCLSPEDAAQPEPTFFNQGKSGCKYDNFTMSDGHLDATMTCAGGMGAQGPERMRVTLSGAYGTQEYEVHMNTAMSAHGGSTMTQTMTMTAHRAGDCRGDEINAKKN